MEGRWFLSFAIGVSLLAGNSGRVEVGIFKTLRGRGRNTGVVQTVAYANPAPAYVGPSHGTSSVADSCLRNSSGVILRNSQKLNAGNFRPKRPYGV